MTTTKLQAAQGVIAASAVALAVLLFSVSTASAAIDLGDVNVSNNNTANVTNNFDTSASTGYNYAGGSDAGNGGEGAEGGDDAGNGGRGGRGGYNGDGGSGARGGNTGAGGNGGNGGDSGFGGFVGTGNANADTVISNDVNYNNTHVDTTTCGCEIEPQYNIWKKDTSFGGSFSFSDKYNDRGSEYYNYEDEGGFFGGSEETVYNNNGESTSEYAEGEFGASSSEYSKTAEDINYGDVDVDNTNKGTVSNDGETDAKTGGNIAGGSDAGNGDDAGSGGDDAGNGGRGGRGGSGYSFFGNDGGNGARGGNTGDGGNGGHGGDSSNGGEIITGSADSTGAAVNVVNRNISRVLR